MSLKRYKTTFGLIVDHWWTLKAARHYFNSLSVGGIAPFLVDINAEIIDTWTGDTIKSMTWTAQGQVNTVEALCAFTSRLGLSNDA